MTRTLQLQQEFVDATMEAAYALYNFSLVHAALMRTLEQKP